MMTKLNVKLKTYNLHLETATRMGAHDVAADQHDGLFHETSIYTVTPGPLCVDMPLNQFLDNITVTVTV